MAKRALLMATLDTKGYEIGYVREVAGKLGVEATVMDVGLKDPPTIKPDIDRHEVAAACGKTLDEIMSLPRRDLRISAIADGALVIALRLIEEGRMDGVLSVGGNQGTAIATKVMRGLPLGTPKVMVSTVASGNVRPYVGFTDTMMLFPLADIVGGPNSVTYTVLGNAAGAIAGMCLVNEPIRRRTGAPVVALTAFGNIEPCINAEMERLRSKGYEPITFHSSGAGGSAMEALARQGLISGVIDNISHELLGEIYDVDYYRPVKPGRLEDIIRMRLPLVFVPGGLDYYVMGSAETLPTYLTRRRIHYHNPENTNVRTNAYELKAVAKLVAERLDKADEKKAAVIVPTRGWTEFGRAGMPLHDPALDAYFVRCLRRFLHRDIEIMELDLHINDRQFAEACADRLVGMMD